ncbi:MAG: hypothetical protein KDE03_06170 [Rhodobacteraceae bacterium]|nr:hypothetical protein [Paracoccaceae bacterium]
MKKFAVLLCGALVAASLSSPALAGGKTVTGASTTVPASVLVALNKRFRGQVTNAVINSDGSYEVTIGNAKTFKLSSSFVARVIEVYGG